MANDRKCFSTGDFRDDARKAKQPGWFVGKFAETNSPRKTELVELKYWHYRKDEDTRKETKTSCTIECTLILKGKIKGKVDGEDIMLCGGDYVVISPGTVNCLPKEVLEDVEGLTIKAPSIPVAKHVRTEVKKGGFGFNVKFCGEEGDED